MIYPMFTCHKKKVFLLFELCLVSFHLFINVAYVLLKQLNKFVIQCFQTILALKEKLQQQFSFPFIFVFCL